MIQKECVRNFHTLVKACKEDDVSVVLCKDAKGREFQTICVLYQDPSDPDVSCYLPFALMVNPTFYPLLNKLHPPDRLKGEWMWTDD